MRVSETERAIKRGTVEITWHRESTETWREGEREKTLGKMVKKQLAKCEREEGQNPKIPSY